MIPESVVSRVLADSASKKAWASDKSFRRYLYDKVKSALGRYYVGVHGLRGVGKTTLMLQIAGEFKDSVYLSMDSLYLREFSLYEILRELDSRGYKHAFVDEIHSYPGWAAELKNAHDDLEISVMFSGSSALALASQTIDLSRRALLFELKPLSFREYLEMFKGIRAPAIRLEDLFNEEFRRNLISGYAHASSFLQEYLRFGGFPYSTRDTLFYDSLASMLERVIHFDLAYVREVDSLVASLCYRLLYYVATCEPGSASYNKMASSLGVSKTLVASLVRDLERVGLLRTVLPRARGHKLVRKEPKIFLRIPFRAALNYMIGREPGQGSLREEFLVNHLDRLQYVRETGKRTPDYYVAGRIVEVGGRAKKRKRKGVYLATDSLETRGNRIPLFLFGLLY